MYKIVLLVAVFAFAVQGTYSSPVENSAAVPNAAPAKNFENAAAPQDSTPSPSSSPQPGSTTPKTSGASSSEICVLLVQLSSLALVAKHVMTS